MLDVVVEAEPPPTEDTEVAARQHGAPGPTHLQVNLAQVDVRSQCLVATLRDVAPERKAPRQRVGSNVLVHTPTEDVRHETGTEAGRGDIARGVWLVVEALP